MTAVAEPDRTAERARTWIGQRLLLAATVTGTITAVAVAAGVVGTVLAPNVPETAAKLRVAAGLGAMAAVVSAVWLARAAIAAIVVRANGLQPCEITELRHIHHGRNGHTVLRIDADAVPCSVEYVGAIALGPALATRPAHWRVVVAHGDRPRLVNQPWTRSYGRMWNAWLGSPETPDAPVKGPWTTGRLRRRGRSRTGAGSALHPPQHQPLVAVGEAGGTQGRRPR